MPFIIKTALTKISFLILLVGFFVFGGYPSLPKARSFNKPHITTIPTAALTGATKPTLTVAPTIPTAALTGATKPTLTVAPMIPTAALTATALTITAGGPYKITLTGSIPPVAASQSFTISGTITDANGNQVADGTVVSIADGQLRPIVIIAPKVGSAPVPQPSYPNVNASTTTKGGSFSFTQAISILGTYNFRVYSGQAVAYITVVVR